MSRLGLAVLMLVCVFNGVIDCYKLADVPLYRKDTPYCMKSFRATGDLRHKEVWLEVPKETEDIRSYDWILLTDPKTKKLQRDDYLMEKVDANLEYCHPGFNMTAIQMDLGTAKRIVGVVVLGENKIDIDSEPDKTVQPGGLWAHFVSHYTVEHSPDGRIWAEILDERGRPRHFKVTQQYEEAAITINREHGLPRAHLQTFEPNIHARFIRLNVKAFVRRACVPHVDVFGCESDQAKNNVQRIEEPNRKLNDDECSFINPLGMESGEIKDYQIEASSYLKPADEEPHYPYRARWSHLNNKLWCADTNSDKRPWIMVRLSSWPKYVSNIKYEKITVSHDMNIEVSVNGRDWATFKYSPKYLYALCCGEDVFTVYWCIPPVKARYIRFVFTRSKSTGPYKACLKFEVYGCSAETQSISYGQGRHRRVNAGVRSTPTRPDRTRASIVLEGDPYWAWCPLYKDPVFLHFGDPRVKERVEKNYNLYEIDLLKIFAISRIVVQGDRTREDGCRAHTSSVSFIYSPDSKTWVLTRDYNGKDDFKFRTTLLPAVQSPCGYAAIDITPTAFSRYFRVIPQQYYVEQCLRIVLVGYEPGSQPQFPKRPRKPSPACKTSLGMESNIIKDKEITASSHLKHDTRTEPRHARLKQNGGWCVDKMTHFNSYYGLNDSLEIDLMTERIIDGFASQGYSDAMKKRWVTAYVVHYSLDGVSWSVISMREQERVFLANSDPDSIVRHYLNPRIRARKIRFVPVAWHNWVCMRVEIYGCDDGTSFESRLEKKLRDMETQKLALVPLEPDVSLTFNCGDYETWGHTNYLKVNLDRAKSTWYQKAFYKDFPLVEKTLTLATNQFPSDFGSRHFMCIGRTRDNVEMFWQHIIAVQQGPRSPTWLTSPHDDMRNMHSADIPQIVVLQRFDITYDGGTPIWSEPAVVYASGNIASIGVYVIGMPYYPMAIHNCLIENRLLDWHFTNLGSVPNNDYRACARLALSRGYEYMSILGGTNCLSNWYLPLATSPHRTRDEGQCRLEPKVYFINATFEEYVISWYKKLDNDDDDTWIKLVSYPIKPKIKSSPHVSMFGEERDVYKEKMKGYSNGGYYHTYDKALFGDTYTGSHILEIVDMDVKDLGSYKFEVFVPSRGVRNEAMIELRHQMEPQIQLPEHYDACYNVPGPLTVKAVDTDLLDPEVWQAKWFKTVFVGGKAKVRYPSDYRISYQTKGIWNETFLWTEPYPPIIEEYFEVFVNNRYGFTSALSRISVVGGNEIPSISWITSSPFEAVDGVNQILEVRLRTDKQLDSVTWYRDGKPIEAATDRYGFPESTAGVRKKLKLIKIDEKTPGQYRVVVKGKACSFERTVNVLVLVIPRVYFKPQEDYVIARDTDKEVVFNATVKGGNPKPKIQQMKWKKGSTTLVPSYGERFVLFTTLDEDLNWISVLKVRKLRVSDSGDFTFELATGPAVTKKTWRLSVRLSNIDEISNLNQTIPSVVDNVSPPQSAGAKTKTSLLFWILVPLMVYYWVMISN
ncbi:uncharacterized protein LOC116293691 [Actinia tenebrosa]|uniref:Uncharacterized protein LOC116293691 n=1 Tax=Actinia tenebrosa TaxID=6105 RepID=A0A6P8HMT1_ACTTE|nr:uncharacterized protein LOC116293691 [Actinia tenebrosa]